MIKIILNKRVIFSIFATILFTVSGVEKISAQITATNSFFSEPADYDGKITNDVIFYYKDIVSGILRCDVSSSISYTFSWAKFDSENKSWNIISSGLDNIFISEEGGYRVVISDGSFVVNTLHCWVFVPKLNDIEAYISKGDCVELVPAAKCDSIPLIYYDPEIYTSFYVKYGRQFTWEVKGEVLTQKEQQIRISAPYEDTTYKVTVEDKFDTTSSSEVSYTAIAVLAKIKAEILKADVLNEVHDSITKASAPVEMMFKDENKGNITSFSWMLGRQYSTEKNPFYVFTVAGTDTVSLTVRNDMCESLDTMVVIVMESLLEFPNTFTPNGDGINDEFRAAYRSIKNYKITIVNRWGRVVYVSTNPAKGWNGNIGDKQAPVGVYYYYAEGEGYKKNEVHKKTGVLHLIRDK